MKKENFKKTKLISINQVAMYIVWLVILLFVTNYFSTKRNEYYQQFDNEIQNNILKYGYVLDNTISNKSNLNYNLGKESSIRIELEYNNDGYIFDGVDFEYENYNDSMHQVEFYYDVINSILPNIDIYKYKDQIEYAIDNKLYEEDGSYLIKLNNNDTHKKCYIHIYDNYNDYYKYNYRINIEFY